MKKAAKILDIIAVGFTIIFFAYSSFIGGDAFNGIIAPNIADNFVAGEYYVANHGTFFHVTYVQWILSFVITSAFWLSIITALIVNVIAMVKKPPNN